MQVDTAVLLKDNLGQTSRRRSKRAPQQSHRLGNARNCAVFSRQEKGEQSTKRKTNKSEKSSGPNYARKRKGGKITREPKSVRGKKEKRGRI